MSWLSEAHTEWHTVNGWNQVCPLDCGVGEPLDSFDYMTDEELAEYDRWATDAERSRLENTDSDPWADPDFLPDGKDFDPPF